VPAREEEVSGLLAGEEHVEGMILREHVWRELDALDPAGHQERALVVLLARHERVVRAVALQALAKDEQRPVVVTGERCEGLLGGECVADALRDGLAGRSGFLLFVGRELPVDLQLDATRRTAWVGRVGTGSCADSSSTHSGRRSCCGARTGRLAVAGPASSLRCGARG